MTLPFRPTLLAMLCITLLPGVPAAAGSLHGHLFEPYGSPWANNAVHVNRMGPGGAGNQGGATTWAATPVGWFGIDGLNTGTYSVGFSEKDQYTRAFAFGVGIDTGTTDLPIARYPDYTTGARMHFETFQTDFAQSFVALGECVTHVSQRFPTAQQVQVTIHEGGPEGPQIGPMRWIEGSYTNDAHAAWSAGEVPTVPGQLYTARFRAASPISVHFADARNMNGLDFPGGQAYVNGEPFPLPLRTIIGMDTDGISTTINTTKKFQIQSQYVPAVCGQTFHATGTSLIGVNFLVGTNGPLEVAIFESPGADGMGINQIGPAKWVNSIAWNAVSMATWSPDEVPLAPGSPYYARIRQVSGAGFPIYVTGSDEYASGSFLNGGSPIGLDLSGMICCEKSGGSASKPSVVFSDWRVVDRTATSATISWSTTTPSTARIDYGPGIGYTAFGVDNSVSGTHQFTLIGLTPGTEYHCQITAYAEGRRESRSKDIAFVTDPAEANIAANPGFEQSLGSSWTTWGAMARQNQPASGSGGLGGVKARTGNYYIGSASNGLQVKGGAWQKITVDPSRPVNLRASLWTYQIESNEGFDATARYTVRGRIGIDPAGGSNPASPEVVWTPWSSGQQWYDLTADWTDQHPSIYTDLFKSVQPLGNSVTVFLEAGVDTAIVWTIYGLDDVYVWQEDSNITTVDRIGDLAQVDNGTRVSIAGLMVTASAAQVGANYVQEQDRSSGIRVEGSAPFTPGNVVTVQGFLGTTPSGERCLLDGLPVSDIPGTPAVPLGISGDQAGHAAVTGFGPGNVGLLVRAWGKIRSLGPGYFILDDGSIPAGGLKVTIPPGGTPPLSGYLEVTGIVQLEGDPTGSVVLKPRAPTDIRTL